HRAAERQQQDHENLEELSQSAVFRTCLLLTWRKLFFVDRPDHLPRTGCDTVKEFSGAKLWHDDFIDDPACCCVVERAFKTITDFDTHGAVIFGDNKDGAIIDFLPADLPCLGNPKGILLDRFRLSG